MGLLAERAHKLSNEIQSKVCGGEEDRTRDGQLNDWGHEVFHIANHIAELETRCLALAGENLSLNESTYQAQQAIVLALEAHQKCDGVHYAATLGVTDPLLSYIKSVIPKEKEPANDRPN
jgi:hypothetical protein